MTVKVWVENNTWVRADELLKNGKRNNLYHRRRDDYISEAVQIESAKEDVLFRFQRNPLGTPREVTFI